MNDDPVERHRHSAAETLAGGDPEAIKQLYVDLGEDVWNQHRDQLESMPLFSLPGTHHVVAREFRDVAGVVLDAGCGPNPALSIAMSDHATAIVSLDIALGTVRAALAVAARQGVGLVGVVGDVERLPFRTGCFAGVACDDTIEHLPDDGLGARELARVARSDASIVIATPNRNGLQVLKRRLIDRSRGVRRPPEEYFSSNSHLREYTWRELERLIRPVLEPRARRGVPFHPRRPDRPIVRVGNWLVVRRPFLWLSPMIVLVTRRRSRTG